MLGSQLARGAVLSLVTGLLGVVVPTTWQAASTPASAAVPCVVTYAGTPIAVAPDADGTGNTRTVTTIDPPESSDVLDVDVTLDLRHPNGANVQVNLSHTAGRASVLLPRITGDGAVSRPLTFDDEATATYTVSSPAGTYRPPANNPLSEYDGTPVGAPWTLAIYNYSNTGTTARLNGWSMRVTRSSCDEDGDGVEDRGVDNCLGLSNPDQVDLDGDGTGNECDPDLDGDGATNNADNCLTVPNLDQVDTDGDGSGNACDGDGDGDGVISGDNCPTVPNPGQADTDADGLGDACDSDPDGDGLTTTDRCPLVAGTTGSGCLSVDRAVALRLRKGRLVGRVKPEVRDCRARAQVAVKVVRPGRDRRAVTVRTSRKGAFTVRVRGGRIKSTRVAGRTVYAVLGATRTDAAECSPARSRRVRIRG